AVLVGVECLTGTLAGDRVATVLDRQFVGTVLVEVGVAAGPGAVVISVTGLFEGAVNRLDFHRQVVTVDQRHVVIVLVSTVVQLDLGQRDRRCATSSVALDLAWWL